MTTIKSVLRGFGLQIRLLTFMWLIALVMVATDVWGKQLGKPPVVIIHKGQSSTTTSISGGSEGLLYFATNQIPPDWATNYARYHLWYFPAIVMLSALGVAYVVMSYKTQHRREVWVNRYASVEIEIKPTALAGESGSNSGNTEAPWPLSMTMILAALFNTLAAFKDYTSPRAQRSGRALPFSFNISSFNDSGIHLTMRVPAPLASASTENTSTNKQSGQTAATIPPGLASEVAAAIQAQFPWAEINLLQSGQDSLDLTTDTGLYTRSKGFAQRLRLAGHYQQLDQTLTTTGRTDIEQMSKPEPDGKLFSGYALLKLAYAPFLPLKTRFDSTSLIDPFSGIGQSSQLNNSFDPLSPLLQALDFSSDNEILACGVTPVVTGLATEWPRKARRMIKKLRSIELGQNRQSRGQKGGGGNGIGSSLMSAISVSFTETFDAMGSSFSTGSGSGGSRSSSTTRITLPGAHQAATSLIEMEQARAVREAIEAKLNYGGGAAFEVGIYVWAYGATKGAVERRLQTISNVIINNFNNVNAALDTRKSLRPENGLSGNTFKTVRREIGPGRTALDNRLRNREFGPHWSDESSLNLLELAALFHLPTATQNVSPLLVRAGAMSPPPEMEIVQRIELSPEPGQTRPRVIDTTEQDPERKGRVFGYYLKAGIKYWIGQSINSILRHTHLISNTGGGKSEMIRNFILQALTGQYERNRGLGGSDWLGNSVISSDPQGELSKDIAASTPRGYKFESRVKYVDFTDDENIVSLNFMARPPRKRPNYISPNRGRVAIRLDLNHGQTPRQTSLTVQQPQATGTGWPVTAQAQAQAQPAKPASQSRKGDYADDLDLDELESELAEMGLSLDLDLAQPVTKGVKEANTTGTGTSNRPAAAPQPQPQPQSKSDSDADRKAKAEQLKATLKGGLPEKMADDLFSMWEKWEEYTDSTEAGFIASRVMDVFVMGQGVSIDGTAIIYRTLFNFFQVCTEVRRNATLFDLFELLDNPAYVTAVADLTKNEVARRYLKGDYAAYMKGGGTTLAPTKSRVEGLLRPDSSRRSLCQPYRTLDLEMAMEQGDVVLFYFSPNLGQDFKLFFQATMFTLTLTAIFARADPKRSQNDMRDVEIFLDEVKELVLANPDGIAQALEQFRKYRAGVTLAHQNRDQLGSFIGRIEGTTNSQIVLSVGQDDSEHFSKVFARDEWPRRQVKRAFDALPSFGGVSLIWEGRKRRPVLFISQPPAPKVSNADTIPLLVAVYRQPGSVADNNQTALEGNYLSSTEEKRQQEAEGKANNKATGSQETFASYLTGPDSQSSAPALVSRRDPWQAATDPQIAVKSERPYRIHWYRAGAGSDFDGCLELAGGNSAMTVSDYWAASAKGRAMGCWPTVKSVCPELIQEMSLFLYGEGKLTWYLELPAGAWDGAEDEAGISEKTLSDINADPKLLERYRRWLLHVEALGLIDKKAYLAGLGITEWYLYIATRYGRNIALHLLIGENLGLVPTQLDRIKIFTALEIGTPVAECDAYPRRPNPLLNRQHKEKVAERQEARQQESEYRQGRAIPAASPATGPANLGPGEDGQNDLANGESSGANNFEGEKADSPIEAEYKEIEDDEKDDEEALYRRSNAGAGRRSGRG